MTTKHTPRSHKLYEHATRVGQLEAERDRLRALNAELLAALEGTLSWLTSYPGGGAMKSYDKARAALAKAKEPNP